ncbi:MAG: histidine--tRNA ligase [Patescibacteria group bacterium]
MIKKKIEKNKKLKNKSETKIIKKKNDSGKTKNVATSAKQNIYSTLRGMKDLLPKSGKMFMDIFHAAENVADAYGFSYAETPILEQASLFIRSIGKGTDVIDKEMYVFEDKDGTKVCLRPEATASFARTYINHGLQTVPQPVKVWYWGQMFRHDRPQQGRYRQFHQFGCESFGVNNPVVDAELVAVAYNTLKDLGINAFVKINSIGSITDRENYLVELVGYLRSKRSYLSEESKKKIVKNPLRILDSKEEQDIEVIAEAPQILDWLNEENRKYFMKVLEYLDEAGIPYVLTPTLVRGLDYYTDTVFELFEEVKDETEKNENSEIALGGGGRYNGLVSQLGGPETPAAGFALGIERILNILEKKAEEEMKQNQEKSNKHRVDALFLAQLGEQASKKALNIIEKLRKNNFKVYHNLAKTSLKAQLELADKAEVKYTLILGQKEVQDGTIIVRDMESGIQEIIDQNKIVHHAQKILN